MGATSSPSRRKQSAVPPKPLPFAPRSKPRPSPRPVAESPGGNGAKLSTRAQQFRRFGLWGALACAAVGSFYTVPLVISMFNPQTPSHPVPEDASDRYDSTAKTYDETVGASEKSIGVDRLRRKLVGQAEGHVLEVSAGTGPSLAHYNFKKVRSLTLLDQSAPMLEIARQKWYEIKERDLLAGRKPANVEFRVQSALDPIEGPKYAKDEKVDEPGKFDTVVQAHGLCSTAQPERLLQRLGEVVKRDGRILLLEHGHGFFGWLNLSLDLNAPMRADKYGCWWNKDIGALVRNSGLEIVKISRPWYHLGTTWWIELRKGHDAEQEHKIQQEVESPIKQHVMAQQQEAVQKRGWLW